METSIGTICRDASPNCWASIGPNTLFVRKYVATIDPTGTITLSVFFNSCEGGFAGVGGARAGLGAGAALGAEAAFAEEAGGRAGFVTGGAACRVLCVA